MSAVIFIAKLVASDVLLCVMFLSVVWRRSERRKDTEPQAMRHEGWDD